MSAQLYGDVYMRVGVARALAKLKFTEDKCFFCGEKAFCIVESTCLPACSLQIEQVRRRFDQLLPGRARTCSVELHAVWSVPGPGVGRRHGQRPVYERLRTATSVPIRRRPVPADRRSHELLRTRSVRHRYDGRVETQAPIDPL